MKAEETMYKPGNKWTNDNGLIGSSRDVYWVNKDFHSKLWISRIKRGPIKDFTVTKHTKLCSAHFRKEDFVDFYAVEKNLNFLLDNERT
ncbi:hypothetical protein P5673_005057 [Acropora cervicornis]|uniref:THAP-type domain-containing protein n=1 Tax=Acropora cervicornis TaxID=6130 RepID=A0AAD9VD86_ACRCE|nr:hypothetical protein P5673_005057 [Acropora cervicornis]